MLGSRGATFRFQSFAAKIFGRKYFVSSLYDPYRLLVNRSASRVESEMESRPMISGFEDEGNGLSTRRGSCVGYKFPGEYRSAKELAEDEGLYANWRDEYEERKRLSERRTGLRSSFSRRVSDTFYKEDEGKSAVGWTGAENFSGEIDDCEYDTNYENWHYELNGTRIPQELNHWVEKPNEIKSKRDLRLRNKIRRLEEVRKRIEARKALVGNSSSSMANKKSIVTRRMQRINNLLLEQFNDKLDELPTHFNGFGVDRIAPGSNPIQIFSGLRFTQVEVSHDLSHAKLYWDYQGSSSIDSAERQLLRFKKILRHLVAASTNFKRMPDIVFVREEPDPIQLQTGELVRRVEKYLARLEATNDDHPESQICSEFLSTSKHTNHHENLQVEFKKSSFSNPDPIPPQIPQNHPFSPRTFVDRIDKIILDNRLSPALKKVKNTQANPSPPHIAKKSIVNFLSPNTPSNPSHPFETSLINNCQKELMSTPLFFYKKSSKV